MPDDHDQVIPGPTTDVDWYEKVLTKGDRLVGYIWYKGRKFPVLPHQTIIRIPVRTVYMPMRGKDE